MLFALIYDVIKMNIEIANKPWLCHLE